jgi:predicted ATPase/DNA-binding CsgD family transcriptional regulator
MSVSSVEAPVLRLPHPINPLLGRQHELTVGQTLLRDRHVRLVTFTGPGGVGKTRLAIELAQGLATEFPDGVHYVPLADITEPDAVASAIAWALGMRVAVDQSVVSTLLDELPDRDALVVLDNFEQAMAAAPLVADLLAAGFRLKFLITSRVLLRLTGEHQLPVPPLPIPDPSLAPPLDELQALASVRLFADRARAATGDFAVTAENQSSVATICARLDGLSLAIELAAARLRHVPLATIVDRLARPLDLLVGGPRDQPERLQTLRAAIAWSYDLLEPTEQALFRRLAVFVGGWTLEAATETVGDLADSESTLLERLSSLVDDTLATRISVPTGDTRFSMLETIREFGLEQLQRSDEWQDIAKRHGDYFLAFARRAREGLDGPEQAIWMSRLTLEQDNIRAVFARAFEAGNAATVLRLGSALWNFWAQRGHLTEGRAILKRGLAIHSDIEDDVRAEAIYSLGILALDLNDYAEAHSYFQQSLAAWRDSDANRAASALSCLGIVARDTGHYDDARRHIKESLAIWSSLDDLIGVAIAEHSLGHLDVVEGNYEGARTHLETALRLRRQLGDTDSVAYSLWALATTDRFTGDLANAKARFRESLTLFRDVGDRQGEAFALRGLAGVAERSGDDLEALKLFRESLTLRQALGERNGIVECIDEIAAIAGRRGRLQEATRLLSATTALRAITTAAPTAAERQSQDQTIALARRTLPSSAFNEAWAEGQLLSLERAASLALQLAADPQATPRSALPFNLSPREREVLVLLAEHLSDREIADRLFLSPRTVERHVGSILAKLEAPNRRYAAAYAARHGIT